MNCKLTCLCLLLAHNTLLPAIYKLTHPLYNPGFFSVFHTVLGALDAHDRSSNGLIVDFEDQGLYYDARYGPNWWEYYFEPINFSYNNQPQEKLPTYKKINFALITEFEMSRARGYELIQKYIRLKPHIQDKLDTFVQQYFAGQRAIGIHYRGTDKKSEEPTVPYETVAHYLDLEISEHNNIKIFVATDDAHFLAFMRKRFPEKVIALDAIRSQDQNPVHFPHSENAYQKGEEALLDCLLLSRCAKLYKMASNLSNCSAKFNPSIPVVNLNQSYSELPMCSKYNVFKALNTALALLDIMRN